MKLISTPINLFFLVGTELLLLFIVLSGGTNHFPFNRFYWVKGDTSSIPNAFSESLWTFWGVCDSSDYGNCRGGPGYPIVPQDNFRTRQGVPQEFLDNRSNYYYLLRFSFAFIMLATAFVGVSLLLLAMAFALDSVQRTVTVLVALSCLWIYGAAACQTAVLVLARNAFHNAGRSASIGVKLTALIWTSVVTITIVLLMQCSQNIVDSYQLHMASVRGNQGLYYEDAEQPVNDESSFTREVPQEKEPGSGGIRFFRIKRNQKPADEESV